ncbi:UNVERIFIED_CONTAM: integrase core domain-containing protein, partial [Kocuria sp. CPCC 205295]|uniref:integrase core domain-containing protein n=1 Tax=Kocuria sp. CPCC 205295 TaxID=3073557 RepID=UPI0036D93652
TSSRSTPAPAKSRVDNYRSVNALMETINGVYKAECVRTTIFHDGPYKTIADVEFATAGWVDWYNHRRLHGSLGMVSPDEFEAAYYAALNPEPLPA